MVYFMLLAMFSAALGLGALLFIIYFVTSDSHESRRSLPFALFAGYVANSLILLWTIIYIGAIYEYDKVYVISGRNP